MLIFQNTFLATRSRSRSNILMDQHGDHEGSSQETIPEVQPEEVLVISLGAGPQITPGMMSENEVCNIIKAQIFRKIQPLYSVVAER